MDIGIAEPATLLDGPHPCPSHKITRPQQSCQLVHFHTQVPVDTILYSSTIHHSLSFLPMYTSRAEPEHPQVEVIHRAPRSRPESGVNLLAKYSLPIYAPITRSWANLPQTLAYLPRTFQFVPRSVSRKLLRHKRFQTICVRAVSMVLFREAW